MRNLAARRFRQFATCAFSHVGYITQVRRIHFTFSAGRSSQDFEEYSLNLGGVTR